MNRVKQLSLQIFFGYQFGGPGSYWFTSISQKDAYFSSLSHSQEIRGLFFRASVQSVTVPATCNFNAIENAWGVLHLLPRL